MTLAESLIHELIDTSVLKLSRAIEIVQSAVDVQTAIEVDRYGASASEPRAVRPLSAILLSLQIDHNRAGALSAT